MRMKHVPLYRDDEEFIMLPMAEVFFPPPEVDHYDEELTVDAPSQTSTEERTILHSVQSKLGQHEPVNRFLSSSVERSFTEQLNSLSRRERSCVMMLKQHWESDNQPIPGIIFLRFARFNNFNIKAARRALNNFDKRYLNLTVAKVGPILQTKTLFPVPGLKSKDGLDMFYMRPSRYFPKRIQTKYVIDNQAYVMTTMIEKEQASKNGIGFLACMDEWTMENFSVDYCLQFMKMLQGGVPARVGWFLIVNPPSWFDVIWKIMKPMLAPKFRRKVKMIPESKLPQFLAPGYEEFLPDDMRTGKASTKQIVKDFVAYRRQIETCKQVGIKR